MIPWPANAASPWIRSGRQRVRLVSTDAILLGAHAPLHHRVHPLEVARVERQRQVHVVRPGSLAVGPKVRSIEKPRWYFTSPPVPGSFGSTLSWNSAKISDAGLLQHVGEHVEAPAVRHADHDLDDAGARGALDQPFQQRDQALRAFQREALVAQELVLEELLEHLGADHLVEQLQPILARQHQPVARRFHPALQPGPQLDVVQVGELDADGPAVRLAQQPDQLAQRRPVRAGDVLAAEHQVEILLGEPEVLERDRRQLAPHQPERVEVGGQVPELAIAFDQALHAFGQQPDRYAAAGDARARHDRRAGRREDAAPERGRRNHRRRGRPAVDAGAGAVPVQPLEVPPPGRVDAGGIVQELEVELLDEREVREREPRQRAVAVAVGMSRGGRAAIGRAEQGRIALLAGRH